MIDNRDLSRTQLTNSNSNMPFKRMTAKHFPIPTDVSSHLIEFVNGRPTTYKSTANSLRTAKGNIKKKHKRTRTKTRQHKRSKTRQHKRSK